MEEEPIQGIFDFATGNQDGYENWRREQEAKEQRIRDVWKIPVGRKVRVTLRNIRGVFEGKLKIWEPPAVYSRHEPLYLKIGKTGFYNNEVESCVIIE